MLKWLKRGAITISILIGAILAVGIVFEQWSRWRVGQEYPPTGVLYDIDGRGMHLYCIGHGEPTVVFESGAGGGSVDWVLVQRQIATTNRACSYDRSGIAWSDPVDEPLTADLIADRLHQLLRKADEAPPYVMVGHSLGGPLTMVFTDKYPLEVAGVVLVDSSHPEQMQRFSPEIQEALGGPPPPAFLRFAAATGLLRLMAPGFFSNVPEEAVAGIEYFPESMQGVLAEFDAFDSIFSEAGEAASFDTRPLIVLTAGKLSSELPAAVTPEIEAQMMKTWNELQIELAGLSVNSERRVIEDATHYIQYDNPGAVIDAIRDVSSALAAAGGRE